MDRCTETLNSAGVATLTTSTIPGGRSSITASYTGDSQYGVASSTAATVTVSQIKPAITLVSSVASVTYGAQVELTATLTGSGAAPTGSVAFYSGSVAVGQSSLNNGTATLTLASLPAGKLSVTAHYGGDSNYTAVVSAAASVTVNKGAQTITFAPLPSAVSFGAGPLALSATASSGLAVTFSITGPARVSGTTLTTTGVGTVVITASQGGSADYLTATSVSQTIAVNKAAQAITFKPLATTQTYGVKPLALSATASSGLAVTFGVTGPATVSGTTLTITGAGTVVVTANQNGNADYAAATPVSQTITVNKATQAITFKPLATTQTYGVKPFALSANASSGLPVTFGATGPATVSGTTLTVTGAGTVVVTANQNGNANYAAAAPATQTIEVNKAAQSIAFAPLVKTQLFQTKQLTLNATASSGLAVTFTAKGPAKVSGNTLAFTGSGTIVVTASQGGNANYAAAMPVSQSILVVSASHAGIFPQR